MAGPNVTRTVKAVWTVTHRWGPEPGDRDMIKVYRIDGSDQVSLKGKPGRVDQALSVSEARELGHAILAACDWQEQHDQESDDA